MSSATVARLQEHIEVPLRPRAWGFKGRLLASGLGLVVAWGVFAWFHQLDSGLVVTGLGNRVPWGLYITDFVFFIGISYAGTLVSAILRLSHAGWRRPITRLAEMITVVGLSIGSVLIVVDMGRPERLLNVVRFPHLHSPLTWDMLAISTYLIGSIIYLYLPLIPDLAVLSKSPTLGPLRRRVYRVLSLRWARLPEQRASLNKSIAILAVLLIPVAIAAHTVVGWIFGMTLREGWDSTIYGPYFVVGAIFSGIAGLIVVMAILRRVYHLEEFITEKHFRYLGWLLLVFGLLYAYFTGSEYLTMGYKLNMGSQSLLHELTLGQYAVPFWTFGLAGLVVPLLLLSFRRTRTIKWIPIAGALVLVGMWCKRLVIVVPSLALPTMPYEWGVYQPTWVEWSITAAAFAAFTLMFMVLVRCFPMISVWEVDEGLEREEGLELEPVVEEPLGSRRALAASGAEGGKR